RIGRQHADNRRGAADREALDRLPAELRVADRLESVIDAEAPGQRAHRLHRVVFGAVDEMRRAEPARDLLLRLELIDRDDLAGAPDARALDDREADAAAAEHRNGLPGLEPRTAQRRADTGQAAAADESGAVQRDLRNDPHD